MSAKTKWDEGREDLDSIIEHNKNCPDGEVIYDNEDWFSDDGEIFANIDDAGNLVEYHPEGDIIVGSVYDDD